MYFEVSNVPIVSGGAHGLAYESGPTRLITLIGSRGVSVCSGSLLTSVLCSICESSPPEHPPSYRDNVRASR